MKSLIARIVRRAGAAMEGIRERPLQPGDQLPPLQALPGHIKHCPFPRAADRIQGWLHRDECRALYALAFYVSGPFLEIGSWVGKSTTCIALGIRDSGGAKRLTACELNPTLENFRPYAGGLGFFVPANSATPLCDVSPHTFEKDFKPVLLRPGGALRELEWNLTSAGLRDYVSIVEGDFRNAPVARYGFVFADTLHSPAEIERNLPALRAFIGAGTILACHDTNAENEACIRALVPLRSSCMIHTLFVGEIGAGM